MGEHLLTRHFVYRTSGRLLDPGFAPLILAERELPAAFRCHADNTFGVAHMA
jgi:hypothetical protein